MHDNIEAAKKFFVSYVHARRNGSCSILTSQAIKDFRTDVADSPLSDEEVVQIFAEMALTFHFSVYFDGKRRE